MNIMYWDIVEVKSNADDSLFVRFKDGTEGIVRLREEQLTGALELLRDQAFFQSVFIDHGSVGWPGEIDLAPVVMYAEISAKRKEINRVSCLRSRCCPRLVSFELGSVT